MSQTAEAYKKLKLADNLELPLEAITQKFAFLGRTGSGKTYGAGKLAELFLDAGAQIVVLDGIGVWYGLRLRADGKGKGFSVPVFGGEQGDVPLEPQAGRLIAKLIVEEGFSAVLDVSNFRKHERKTFVTDFAEELFHRKKTNRSALHFFCEESQMFIPERSGKDGARMLGAFEDLIKLGRNYGIGASLISQRPQAVNKEVLNQTEILLAFQMTGPHERKAIAGWIAEKGMDTDLVDELPGLDVGDAWIWSPQFLKVSKQIHIAKKRTYDASSTPEVGAAIAKPKELSPVDVEKIKTSMADVVKRAEESDPKKLQAEIRRLNAELAKKPASAPQSIAEPKIKEVPVITDAQLEKAKRIAESMDPLIEKLEAKLAELKEIRYVFVSGAERVRLYTNEKFGVTKSPVAAKVPSRPAASPIQQRPAEPREIGELKLNRKQQEILDAVAWWESIGIESPTGIQVGAVALIDPTGGHFSNLVGPLSANGLIERESGRIRLTDSGRMIATPPETASTLDGYHDILRARVRRMKQASGRTVDVLNAIIAADGNSITTEEIGQAVGIDHTGGHFSNTIGPLSTAGLITRSGGVVSPTDVLFPAGLA